MLLNLESLAYRDVAAHYVALKETLDELDRNQVERIRSGASKTRLSILFYGINNAVLKISEQVLQLLTLFDETFALGKKGAGGAGKENPGAEA
jgi:hypothetical protein